MAPGDPAELKAGVGSEGAQRGNQQLNEQIINQIRAQWHLDKPVWYWTIFSDEKNADGELKPLSDRVTFKWNGTNNQYQLLDVRLASWRFRRFVSGSAARDR